MQAPGRLALLSDPGPCSWAAASPRLRLLAAHHTPPCFSGSGHDPCVFPTHTRHLGRAPAPRAGLIPASLGLEHPGVVGTFPALLRG